MSNDINLAGVVTALNNKADTNLENSAKASEIERLANSTHQLAEATSQIVTVFVDTVEKDIDNLESNKFNKSGGAISGSVSITKNLDVSGIATVPTPVAGTNDNQIATTAFVGTAVANLVGSAPETLNTLGELATAFQEHEEVTDAINASIATKANDSNVVHKTGNEDISGFKTFRNSVAVKLDVLDTDTPPESTTYYMPFTIKDKDDTNLFALSLPQDIEGSNYLRLLLRGNDGIEKEAFSTKISKDGTITTKVPTTPTNAVDNEVLTANYAYSLGGVGAPCKNLGNVDVDTLLNPGNYYITGNATNLPSGTSGYVIVLSTNFNSTGSLKRQIFYRSGTLGTADHLFFTRLYDGSVWGEWYKLLTDKDETVVRTTGDQTIAGTKTFSSTISGSISGNAATATKATQDASGNVITSTYATKTELANIDVTGQLHKVATSGSYTDLTNTPTSLKNPTSLTLQNSAGTSIGAYDGSTAKTIKLTSSTVGLGNVTNESKATMFTNAALTGTPTAPTPDATVNDTKIATTAWVRDRINKIVDCSTAADTVAKEVTVDGFVLEAGARVLIRFTVTNTAASPTLNVSGTGAKAIYYRNAAITAGYLAANRIYEFVYDGAQYELIGDVNTDTNTKVTQTVTTTNAEYALLAMADAAATTNKTNSTRFASAVTLNPSTQRITAKGLKSPAPGTTYVSTAQDNGAVLDTSVTAGAYMGYERYPSTNGAFTHYGHTSTIGWKYFTKDNIDNSTNTAAHTLSWNESGILSSTGGFSGSLSGNASTATKLATARTIDGVSFNGSDAISHFGTTDDDGTTAAKTITTLTGFTLVKGAEVTVLIGTSDSSKASALTLNVNGTGAKTLRYKAANFGYSYWQQSKIYKFVYDGTYYRLIGELDTNTTYTAASATPLVAGTAAVGTSAKYAREDHVHPLQTSVSGSSGSCTGNAATATKATQDSAGQQINTTYIKGLSVSGKTITYTKGDGTTGTITTQDTNTTYSNMTAATADAAGKAGLVPAPAAGKQTSFLRGDGTWVVPTNTDTKVTNTLATTTKAYVTGTTSATTNTGTQVFDTGVYLGTTAGYLHVTRIVFSNGAQLWIA